MKMKLNESDVRYLTRKVKSLLREWGVDWNGESDDWSAYESSAPWNKTDDGEWSTDEYIAILNGISYLLAAYILKEKPQFRNQIPDIIATYHRNSGGFDSVCVKWWADYSGYGDWRTWEDGGHEFDRHNNLKNTLNDASEEKPEYKEIFDGFFTKLDELVKEELYEYRKFEDEAFGIENKPKRDEYSGVITPEETDWPIEMCNAYYDINPEKIEKYLALSDEDFNNIQDAEKTLRGNIEKERATWRQLYDSGVRYPEEDSSPEYGQVMQDLRKSQLQSYLGNKQFDLNEQKLRRSNNKRKK